MPTYLTLSLLTVMGASMPMGKVALRARTAAMWYDPVASIAALPLANICSAGSTAVPVAFGCMYGISCWYFFSIPMNQSSVTL